MTAKATNQFAAKEETVIKYTATQNIFKESHGNQLFHKNTTKIQQIV